MLTQTEKRWAKLYSEITYLIINKLLTTTQLKEILRSIQMSLIMSKPAIQQMWKTSWAHRVLDCTFYFSTRGTYGLSSWGIIARSLSRPNKMKRYSIFFHWTRLVWNDGIFLKTGIITKIIISNEIHWFDLESTFALSCNISKYFPIIRIILFENYF